MGEKRCGDCEYFVAFRNMNHETCTCDTITEYCELLQNEDTYDRDTGDEIWNDVFEDCPLKTGHVSTESAIHLLQSEKEVCKQFDNYVRISCEKKKKLQEENEQLRKKLECCEYEHFLNELDEIHEKVDKGDLSNFKSLKQEEKNKQIEEDYARLQRRKILERSGNCKPLTLKYNPNITYMG